VRLIKFHLLQLDYLFIDSISLIYTATQITMTTNVQVIAMNANIIPGATSVQMSGWGNTGTTGGVSTNNLQRITTATITNYECRDRHNTLNANRIGDSKICTFTRSTQGTCFGDEGGGLIASNLLIGVSSWQVPCATGVPDVYERISSHRVWILSITG
jgi:trypsin